MAKPAHLSPGWTDAITRANKALAQISESQLKMAQQAARTIEAYRLDWLQDLVKTVQRARETLVEAWPPNWQEMSAERISKALDLAEVGTIPIIWVPPRPILEEIVDASTFDHREAVLSRHRGELLNAARQALAESRVEAIPEQAELARFADEAIAAAEADLDRAAQTLAAAGLGCLIHDVLGFKLLGEAFKELGDRMAGDASIHELRIVALQIATSNTLIDIDREPIGFNRHGTQHGAPVHFTEPAMLASVMLLVGWIRELSDLAEHHPEVFKEAPAEAV